VRVEGTRDFAAPRDAVWKALNDPEQMAQVMPGVQSFDVHDDSHWTANVKIPLGLGGLQMKIAFEKTDVRPPEHAKLVAKGQGVGAIMNMETSFELSVAGAGTSMKWSADVKIAGPVGSMGQRVLQPIINQQVASVLGALEKQVTEASAPAADAPTHSTEG
jgi:carbon monoxide dehydrogenase subunit G